MSQVHPMLEKVARAIIGQRNLDAYGDDYWKQWIPEARAAVRALIEPDEGMVEAGESAMIYSVEDFIQNQAESVFRAMLLPLVEGEGE